MTRPARLFTTPAVHHGDPATMLCGDCFHVLPAHPPDGSVCSDCCDGTCFEVDVDEDGNELPPDPCMCCMGWQDPPAPPGTPRTHGSGVAVDGREDGSVWSLAMAVGRVVHAVHSPGTAILGMAAAETYKNATDRGESAMKFRLRKPINVWSSRYPRRARDRPA